MWKNFQKVLEKRVQGGVSNRKDKYFIKQLVEQIILECFGKVGQENIKFYKTQKEKIFLICDKSVWRSEIKLKEKYLLKQISVKIKEKSFFQKIVFKK